MGSGFLLGSCSTLRKSLEKQRCGLKGGRLVAERTRMHWHVLNPL